MLDPQTDNKSALCSGNSYRYKRIKDYIYDTAALLGQGNFSTVYQAVH